MSLPFTCSSPSPPQEYRIRKRPTYPMFLCCRDLTGVWWECLLDYSSLQRPVVSGRVYPTTLSLRESTTGKRQRVCSVNEKKPVEAIGPGAGSLPQCHLAWTDQDSTGDKQTPRKRDHHDSPDCFRVRLLFRSCLITLDQHSVLSLLSSYFHAVERESPLLSAACAHRSIFKPGEPTYS